MDSFDKRKEDVLGKLDKSKKGSVDRKIKKICDIINSKNDYFTTSSCSGRIVVIKVGENRKKNSEWLFTSHEMVEDDNKVINSIDFNSEDIWFKQEPMILHVCCRDVNAANKLWDIAQLSGYKRGGIRKGRHWYNVEIMGSEFIEAPLEEVTKEYIGVLIDEANKRMKRSLSRIKRFERNLE